METAEALWKVLFEIGAIRPVKPQASFYQVIIDTHDLDLVKRYVAGGHAISQRFGGGHSLALAARSGDLEFVRYFIENAPDLDQANTVDGPNSLLSDVVSRIANSNEDSLATSIEVFRYLLEKEELHPLYVSAYRQCAAQKQVTPAQMLIEAGLEDQEVRVGPSDYVTFSDDLVSRNFPDYAALLRGDAVDIERLRREEAKERKTNAQHADLMNSLTVGGLEPELKGAARETRYRTLIDEIRAGQWDAALASTDPHDMRSVIEFAAQNGLGELVTTILESTKPPRKDTQAAAIAAATYGHLEILKSLAARQIKVEKTAKTKNSPLSEACRYGHVDIVRYLLELGANPTAGDSSGHNYTLQDLAGGEGRSEIIALLDKHRDAK